MTYEETYYGRRVVITTSRNADGRWTSSAELMDAEHGGAVQSGASTGYVSEEEARQAALSAAAGAINRSRQFTGKP